MNKLTLGIISFIIIGSVIGAAIFTGKDKASVSHEAMQGKSSTNVSADDKMVHETNKITYSSFEVMPKNIRVKKGTTVTWTNQDAAKHDIMPDNESENFKASELIGNNQSYQFTFNVAGNYSYHCSPHPYMKGTVEVVE